MAAKPMTGWQRRYHKLISWYSGRTAACGRKIDYKSEPTAIKAAVKIERKNGDIFEHYNCWWCNGWHVGHKYRSPRAKCA